MEIKIGDKFGKLTVESFIRSDGRDSAICSCDCGNKKSFWLINLKRGNNKSCGCMQNEKDISGSIFTNLTAIRKSNKKNYWVFQWATRKQQANNRRNNL